jgi:hypothetical protein
MKERTFSIAISSTYGSADDQQLSVIISTAQLVKFFDQLQYGSGIYTALNLRRPGDIYRYLTLRIEQTPDSFKPSGEFYDAATSAFEKRAFRPGDTAGFLGFSSQFDRGEYAPDLDQAWQTKTQSNEFLGFVRSVFEGFNDALKALSLRDDLILVNSEMVKRSAHPLDMVPLEEALSVANFRSAKPMHSNDFYTALTENLSLPTVNSCVYFGYGDLKVLHLMATEQLRRSRLFGLVPDEAFPLAAQIDAPIDCRAWGCKITFYQEGISKKADLFVNDYQQPTTVMSFLGNRRMSTHIVLSSVPQDLYMENSGVQESVGVLVYSLVKSQ